MLPGNICESPSLQRAYEQRELAYQLAYELARGALVLYPFALLV